MKILKLAENSEVTLVDNYKKVAEVSDILLSAAIPSESINIAKNYGILTKSLFLDLNNISPISTMIINNLFDEKESSIKGTSSNFRCSRKNNKFVKGSIIGKINSDKSIIYLSGFNAFKLSFLNGYGLNIKIVGKDIAKASYIKTLRSIYTKGITAVTYDAFSVAKNLGLTNELCEVLTITEGENFEDLAKSRMSSFDKFKNRKFQEMNEILEFLNFIFNEKESESNFEMIKATKNKFKDKN